MLPDDEVPVLALKPHWWFLGQPSIALLAGFVVAVLAAVVGASSLLLLLVILVLVCAVWFGGTYVQWLSTEFVLTRHRVIFQQGVFAKQSVDIPLDHINGVSVEETALERVIGCGTLTIETAARQDRLRVTHMSEPLKVKNAVYSQAEASRRR